MLTDVRLPDVLARWDELRRQGWQPSPEELCADCPDLLSEVRRRLRAQAPAVLSADATFRMLPGPPVPRPATALPAVAGYEVLGVLGRGGMGVVYKARQLSLDRLVALKMVLGGVYAGAEQSTRFRREAEAVARLRHPNIVRIHEVGEQDGHPFLALEYIEGGSLAQKLAGAPPAPRQAARLVELLAGAVHAAHEQGVLHRDLKPANILIDLQGQPHVSDFGLAKRLNEDSGPTQSGDVVGTPSYMAPEQASARKDLTPAVDVYALGAILYELLASRPPFQGATPLDTLWQVLHHDPVPLTRLRRQVPRDLETICLKCLRKEPALRYPSALALADDLARFLAGRPIQARPAGPAERLAKWARRRPGVAALVAAIAGVTLLGVAAVSWEWRQAAANARAEAGARREVERLLASATLDKAVGFCERDDVAQGLVWLARSREMAEHAGDADLERVCRANLAGWRTRLVRPGAALPHDDWVWDVAFSPDGRTALTGSKDRTARLWDTHTGQPLGPPLRHDQPVWSVAFHPGGKFVLTGCGSPDGTQGDARLWDAATGRPVGGPLATEATVVTASFNHDGTRILTLSALAAQLWSCPDLTGGNPKFAGASTLPHPGAVLAAAFSPDGRTVLTGGEDGTARLWDAATCRALGEPLHQSGPVLTAAFRPDGRAVAVASVLLDAQGKRIVGGEVRLWDVTGGAGLGQVMNLRGEVRALAFSPDGRLLLTGSAIRPAVAGGELEGEARLWEAETGEPAGPALAHPKPVWALAFSPDGRSFVTGCEDRNGRLWATATGCCLAGMGQRDLVRSVAFSPDGRSVLLGSAGEHARARVWEVPPGQAAAPAWRQRSAVAGLAASADGHTLLVGEQGTVYPWDVRARQQCGPSLCLGGNVTAVAFSHDGKTAAVAGVDSVQLFDVATGQPRGRTRPFPFNPPDVVAVALAPDGREVVVAGRGGSQRYDTATGQPLGGLLRQGGVVTAVAFAPDGRTFLTGADVGIRVWDAATGQLRGEALSQEGSICALAFSPDGRTFVTGSRRQRAQLWETATGRPVAPAFAHGSPVVAVAFSADGRTLLTGSKDGTARVWDVGTGKPLGPPLPHAGAVVGVAFRPEGQGVITGCADGTVQVWDVPLSWPGDGRRLRTEVEALAGMVLEDNDVVRILDPGEEQQRRQNLQAPTPIDK
jgi:WD40 repeat protein